ncbi:MAG: class I SAM-dependent methyltransferase [Fidelibacterota bacterium]
MKREPESEIMDDEDEAISYASAAALKYLSRIDDTFVDHFFRLGVRSGVVLDVGTGPGMIPIKIARRSGDLEITGIDLSDAMLRLARDNLLKESTNLQVNFKKGNAVDLDFDDASFDAVISNSLLHHLEDPIPALNEMNRVVKSDGAILIRDIRRPPGILYPFWAWLYGRYYEGKMKIAYENSLKAAFTWKELAGILKNSDLKGCRMFRHSLTHIGIERKRT